MINLKFKDSQKRKLFKKFEHSKYIYNLIESNISFPFFIYLNVIQLKKINVPQNSCFIRLTKRCVLTNKNKILNNYFKLSRQSFLKFARFNLIFGIKKNSW